jgi:hypothetical protein
MNKKDEKTKRQGKQSRGKIEKRYQKAEEIGDEILDLFFRRPEEIQTVTDRFEQAKSWIFIFPKGRRIEVFPEEFYPIKPFWQKFSTYLLRPPTLRELEILRIYLEENTKNGKITKISTETGWQNGSYFVGVGKFDDSGFQKFHYDESSPWFDFSEIDSEDPTILFDFLKEFPCPEVSYSLAAFLAVSPLKFSIPGLDYYPAYFLAGEQGSGKTTLIRDFFLPTFGLKPQSFPADDTPFASLDAWGLQIPRFFDEFRISESNIKEFLKLLDLARYRGGKRRKGTNSLTVQEFPLAATAIIAGETPPLSSRTKERIILNFLPKKKTRPFFPKFQSYLDRKPQRFFPCWIKFLIKKRKEGLQFPTSPLLVPTLPEVRGFLDLPVRIQQNLLILHFGFRLLKEFAKENDIPFSFPKSLYLEIFEKLIENLTEAISGDLEQFLEDCAEMEEEGRFLPFDYWWDKKKQVFWFSPTRIYNRWRGWLRIKNLTRERTMLSSEAIRHLLMQLDSFIEKGKPYIPGKKKQLRMLAFSKKIF